MYSRETFLAVPDTNVSHPDLPGLAASLLQSTRRRIAVNSKCQLAKSGLQKQHTTVHDDTSRCRLKQARCQPRQIRMRYVCVGDSQEGFTVNTWSTADFWTAMCCSCLAPSLRGIFSVWRETSIPKIDCLRKAFAASGKKKLDRYLPFSDRQKPPA